MREQKLNSDYASSVIDSADRQIRQLLSQFPALPPVIRYYDEFDDVVRSIASPAVVDEFNLIFYGQKNRLDMTLYPPAHRALAKQVFLHLLGEGLNVASAFRSTSGASYFSTVALVELIQAGPLHIARKWPVAQWHLLKPQRR